MHERVCGSVATALLLVLVACADSGPGPVRRGDRPPDAGDPVMGDAGASHGDPHPGPGDTTVAGDQRAGDVGAGDPELQGDAMLAGDSVLSGDGALPQGDDAPAGVFLQRSGTVLTHGSAPFQRIAVNKVDLFWQFLGVASRSDVSVTRPQAIQSLDDAVNAGFCCLRIAAVGYYPNNMDTWVADPDAHWSAFDAMMSEVRVRGLKIIPVIWWNTWLFADMAGEPLQETFVDGSDSTGLLYDYATQLVSRYADDDAVLFWELTNEINLGADLDWSKRPDSGINPPGGTPAERTAADNYSTDEMASRMGSLATLVHALDPNHLVSAGYSTPRKSALHLRSRPEWHTSGADWTADSPAEMQQYLALTHPDPIDILSIHVYDDGERWGIPGDPDPDQLEVFKDAADAIGKPLYVGEFGDVTPTVSEDRSANFTRRVMLEALELRVPLSLIWTWEFYQFAPDQPSPHSIEPGTDDALIAAMEAVDGWLASAPTTRGSTLPIVNGGFELDANADTRPDGWETQWRNGTSTGWSATRYQNAPDVLLGTSALRLDAGTGDPDSTVFALSNPIAVNGGEHVVLSAALRFNLDPGETAYFTLVEYDGTGSELGISERRYGPGGGWKLVVQFFDATLRAETRSVRVRLGVGGGEGVLMDVDDVRLSVIQ